MPSKVQTKKHHAALPYKEIASFMAELRQRVGISARALEFSILTVARSGEIRGAEWSEIDLDAKTWIIPAERMKAAKNIVYPCLILLLSFLRSYHDLQITILFSSPSRWTTVRYVINSGIETHGRSDLTQHGFRSTFREWAGEKQHTRER
jgi:integrase